MNLSDFKIGDVICSPKFIDGKLLMVKSGVVSDLMKDCLICNDITNSYRGQQYRAYTKYNWRLATDDDYIRQLIPMITSQEFVGDFTVSFEENAVFIESTWSATSVMLSVNQAAQLRDVLTKNIIGGGIG